MRRSVGLILDITEKMDGVSLDRLSGTKSNNTMFPGTQLQMRFAVAPPRS
jgi:hypothetical protein